MKKILLLSVVLALGACTTGPNPTDDHGRIRSATDPYWWDLVATSSDNPGIRDAVADVVGENFSVRLVSVPKSHFLVRLNSCSEDGVVALCASTQFNGHIFARETFSRRIESGVDAETLRILETLMFREPDVQEEFVEFVETAMNSVED